MNESAEVWPSNHPTVLFFAYKVWHLHYSLVHVMPASTKDISNGGCTTLTFLCFAKASFSFVTIEERNSTLDVEMEKSTIKNLTSNIDIADYNRLLKDNLFK